jgi:hypothetical protein
MTQVAAARQLGCTAKTISGWVERYRREQHKPADRRSRRRKARARRDPRAPRRADTRRARSRGARRPRRTDRNDRPRLVLRQRRRRHPCAARRVDQQAIPGRSRCPAHGRSRARHRPRRGDRRGEGGRRGARRGRAPPVRRTSQGTPRRRRDRDPNQTLGGPAGLAFARRVYNPRGPQGA